MFTNELLLFASEMKGEELDEGDFHTLSNIWELNMGEEPEKFCLGRVRSRNGECGWNPRLGKAQPVGMTGAESP